MKKLLLLIIIGGLVAKANAVAVPVFDLPKNTPGLQNNGMGVNPPTIRIQVIDVQIPIGDQQQHIYFPADGSQPTTQDAVNYALANVDNRENSPITDWYMQMFGVIPINQAAINAAVEAVYVQAGWSAPDAGEPINAQRIISFPPPPHDLQSNHNQVGIIDIQDPDSPGVNISRLDLFRRNFRKIATTAVGRMLLYRIMIEIRRHVVQGNNTGCLENGVQEPLPGAGGLNIRNKNRNIAVYSGNRSYYNEIINAIRIRETNGIHTVIGRAINHQNDALHSIGISTSSIDISLFHEMTHWYHYLRDPARSDDELNINNEGNAHINLQDHHLGYYWQGLCPNWDQTRQDISMFYWSNVDELRNILGTSQVITNNNYRQGDDLSENLYRVCVGYPIRFGHANLGFYEDARVINKVISVTLENYVVYTRNYTNPPNIEEMNYQGLGNCRIKYP